MIRGEQGPSQSPELEREIVLQEGEMIAIAEVAQACIDSGLKHDWAIISDRSLYKGIPHHNHLRSPDFRLALKNSRFSSLDIDVPKKDEDIRIRITAHAEDLPNRSVELVEFDIKDDRGERGFFVNDSHAFAFARMGGRPVDSYMSQPEVAHWLYLQADLDEPLSTQLTRNELDPVRDACEILSTRAQQYINVKQLKVAFSPDLEMYGQLVEARDPSNQLAKPLARRYTSWVTKYHEIDDYPITERLLVEFSPDDIAQGFDFSTISRATVALESSHPTYDTIRALAAQAIDYEEGKIQETFTSIQKRLKQIEECCDESTNS